MSHPAPQLFSQRGILRAVDSQQQPHVGVNPQPMAGAAELAQFAEEQEHVKAPCELSVVVPFYNPGAALSSLIDEVLRQFDSAGVEGEVIAVNDGSTDGSARSISEVDDNRLTVLTLPVNSGKGAALRAGFARSRGRYVGMLDADGDISPRHLIAYRELAIARHSPIVIGSREVNGSQNHVAGRRRAMSEVYSGLVRVLFDVHLRDTQVGCKLFEADALAKLLPQLQENRFVVDLEMLVLAEQLGIGPVLEAPVEIRRVEGSTIKATTAMRMIVDTLTLFGRLRAQERHRHEIGRQMDDIAGAKTPRTVELFGVQITDEHPYDFVSRSTQDFAADRTRRTVLAMHITALNAIEELGVRDALAAADYLHADGVSVSIIARCAGAKSIAAIPTTDLGPRYLRELEELQGRPVKVAIVGGEPGIAVGAGAALARDHGIEVVMTEHGFHTDWVPVLERLRESHPDVVFIGLGMPLEARWVQQWLPELPNSMIITCGGWLRLLSGDETRAPAWLLRLHLEFAWRWATDFKRTNARYSRGIRTVALGCAASLRARTFGASKQRTLTR